MRLCQIRQKYKKTTGTLCMLKNLIQSFFQKYRKKVSKKLADLKRDLDAGSKMHMPVTSLQPSLT